MPLPHSKRRQSFGQSTTTVESAAHAFDAIDHRAVALTWDPPPSAFRSAPRYTVCRDDRAIAETTATSYRDDGLAELTAYRYQIAAQDGDFCHRGPPSATVEIRTPADIVPPVVKDVWTVRDTACLRVRFSKPMHAESLLRTDNYQLAPPIAIHSVRMVAANSVELVLAAPPAVDAQRLTLRRLADNTASRNPLQGADGLAIAMGGAGAAYDMELSPEGTLLDRLGGAGDATLHGDARVVPGAGPFGGPALVLDGDGDFAEASNRLNLGSDDFTIAAWIWREGGSTIVVSKGNGFADPAGWSFGWHGEGRSNSVALRNLNVFRSTAANAVPPNQWTHVAFVRKGGQGLTYANGKPSDGPHDLTALAPLTSEHRLRIGRRAHPPDPAYFKGRIAQLQILPYALTPEEIEAAVQPPRQRAD